MNRGPGAPRVPTAGQAGAMMGASRFTGSTAVSFLHHPAFQSLVLPAVLAAVFIGLLMAWRPRQAALGAVFALVLALAVWPGLTWPPTAGAQKLPWLALAALVVGLLGDAARPGHAPPLVRPWLLAVLVWALAAAWLLGLAQGATLAIATVAGLVVLAVSAWSTRAPLAEPSRAAGSAAALTVAVLGLGAMAGSGGSLLLAQLSIMLAVVSAVAGLWVWWRPGPHAQVTPAALVALALVALALASLMFASGQAHPVALALLALALVSPWWPGAWSPGGARWRPLLVAGLSALPVAAAVVAGMTLAPAPPPATGTDADDAYYTPRWQ